MTRASNYQDILKIIALMCMIIDHIGLYFFPETWILRAVGRYAFPIFCFFAGFNFRNSLRFKTLIYGIALYLFTAGVIFKQVMEANILISIFVGYVYLVIFQSRLNNFWNAYTHFLVLACLWQLTCPFLEYGTLTVAIMVLGYSVKNNLISLPIAAFTAAYSSFLYTLIIYFDDFKTPEFIVTAIVTAAVYFSLTCKKFHRVNNLRLTIISNNLLSIYCLHLVIIMVVWRYSIIGSFLA
jgi:hypothetical protein